MNNTYLRQAIDAIESTAKYTTDMTLDDFIKNQMVQDAVIRQIEILGESIRRLDKNFVGKHTNLPFLQAISIRNKLIHEYDDIDPEIVWETIKTDLPAFKTQILSILSS